VQDRLRPKGMCSGSLDPFKFSEIGLSDNISEKIQDIREIVATEI